MIQNKKYQKQNDQELSKTQNQKESLTELNIHKNFKKSISDRRIIRINCWLLNWLSSIISK